MTRLTWGILCAAAAVLLLLCSLYVLKGEAGGAGAAPLFVVGLALLVGALKSLGARRLE